MVRKLQKSFQTGTVKKIITTAIVEIEASKALGVSLSFSANGAKIATSGAASKPKNIIESQPIEYLKLNMPRRVKKKI